MPQPLGNANVKGKCTCFNMADNHSFTQWLGFQRRFSYPTTKTQWAHLIIHTRLVQLSPEARNFGQHIRT